MTCREALLGLVDQEFEDVHGDKYLVLRPTKPNDIIYDCTHDNPAPLEKFKTGRIALPHLAVASMADQPIASTWGYDHLLPEHLNVVHEHRVYASFNQDNLFTIDGQDPSMRR